MGIIAKLDQLAEMQAEQDAIRLYAEQARIQIVPQEIRYALTSINVEEMKQLAEINQGIEQLTASIKDSVLEVGVTHTGKFLQAVYSKPRVSWDTKALDGYAVGNPHVLQFRKTGEPSVLIRKV